MAETKTSLSDFFRRALGAPLRNSRWSWGAVRVASGQVFLRVWKDEFDTIEGIPCVAVYSPGWKGSEASLVERVQHVDLLRQGAAGYGVACVAQDPDALGPRVLQHFDRDRILEFGRLIETDGNVYAEILGVIAPNVDVATAAVCWWVNHKHTREQEFDGEYLWAPRRTPNSTAAATPPNITGMMPGDVILSASDGAIGAVGVALGRARLAPNPRSSAKAAADAEATAGWQVPVRFIPLERPLRPKEHAAELAPLLSAKNSPLAPNGDINRSAYLGPIPALLGKRLIELLHGQVEQAIDKVCTSTGGELDDDIVEERIRQRTELTPAERLDLIRARRGQGSFRANLERIEHQCRVTGLLDRRHLRARHIKPWAHCDDRERLDGFNGLLLSPHVAHLFARGHVSFSDGGDLLVSRSLNPEVLRSWGIATSCNVGAFAVEQRWYLDYHRTHVFEQEAAGGRRDREAIIGDLRAPVLRVVSEARSK